MADVVRAALAVLPTLALVAACTSASPGPDESPAPAPPAPDPCALVADATVDNVVGPALPMPWVGNLDDRWSGSCTWRLDVDLASEDIVRRPTLRILQVHVFVPSSPTEDLCPEPGPSSSPVPPLGDQARLDGEVLTLCEGRGRADITFTATDQRGDVKAGLDAAQVELVLVRVAREVDERWAAAPRLAPDKSWLEEPAPPRVPTVCGLVGAPTLRAIGTETTGDPDDLGAGAKWCIWATPAVQLRITVTPHGARRGQSGGQLAQLSVRQFAHAWQAESLRGAHDALVVNGHQVLARGSSGGFQVDLGLTDEQETLSEQRLRENATRVLTEAVDAL